MPGLSQISAFTCSPVHVKVTATECSLYCAEQRVQGGVCKIEWAGLGCGVTSLLLEAARLSKPCPLLSPCSGCKTLLFKDFNKHHVKGLCFIKLQIEVKKSQITNS